MIYTGSGQTVTLGTAEGKQFLVTHPAVLSAFNSHFLYGTFLFDITMLYDTRFISADFEKQQNGSSSSTSSGSTSDNHSTQVTTATSSTSVDITNTAGTSVCIATTTP